MRRDSTLRGKVKVDLEQLPFLVLNQMLDKGEELFFQIDKAKAAAAARPPAPAAPKNRATKRKRAPDTRLRATHPW